MYKFIVNPAAKSGHGIEVWEQIKMVLDSRNVEYSVCYSQVKGDITRLAREITSKQSDDEDGMHRVVIVGGDGTLNEAVQGFADYSKLLMGYIPAGSANDYADNAGISQEPLEALEAVLSCQTPTPIDLGYMTYDDAPDAKTKHYFTSSCGVGYDAAVSKAAMTPSGFKTLLNKMKLGDLIYLVMAMKTLIGFKRGDCIMTLDDKTVIEMPHFLFVMSMLFRYEGGGFLFSPDAIPDDGKFDICAFGAISKWLVPIAFPAAFKGTHYKYKHVDPYLATKVHLKLSMPFWVQLDGEVSTKSAAVTIYCNKQYLNLLK